jgi:DNA repair protein RecN (Recombination protein N)
VTEPIPAAFGPARTAAPWKAFSSTTPAIQSWLEANRLDAWDDLIIRREFSRQGRGRIFVNDTPVKLQDLQALGNRLVDLHGQDSAKLLLQREFQLAWIDSNADHAPTIQAYTDVYGRLQRSSAPIG